MTTPTFGDLNHFYLLDRGWDKKPQHKGRSLLGLAVRKRDITENIAIRYKTVLINKNDGRMTVEHYPNYYRISRAKDIMQRGNIPSKDIEILKIDDDDPLREDLVYLENSAASSYDPSRLSNLKIDSTGLAVRFVEDDSLKYAKPRPKKPEPVIQEEPEEHADQPEEQDAPDIGTSPYIVGTPVNKTEMFFGRDSIIEEIKRQLSPKDTSNVILLEGNRRSGKTSILKYLDMNNILPDWILVDISLQGITGHDTLPGIPTRNLYPKIAREIGEAVHRRGIGFSLPGMESFDPDRLFGIQLKELLKRYFAGENYFEDFEDFLKVVIDAVKPLRLLLMFDEFDKLQDGIDSGVTSPQIPENIRYLLHTYSDNLSAIITGSRRLKRLREEYWSVLFGLGHRIGVSSIPSEDARRLITKPVEGKLVFEPEREVCGRITRLTACQPFLIQMICNRIFEFGAKKNQRTITPRIVELSANDMITDSEHFRTVWECVETDRQRLILALCAKNMDRDHFTLNRIEEELEKRGIVVSEGGRVADDLESLRELELIDLDSMEEPARYRITVPLMCWWINRNIDMEDVRQKAAG